MATNNQKPALRILFLIATQKLVHKAVDLMKEEGVPVQYIMFAQGTASSEIMDMLGLGGVEKDLMLSLVPKALAGRLLKRMQKILHLGMPNTGIAFTVALAGCSGHAVRLMETMQQGEERETGRNEREDMENQYSAVVAIVNQGFSEEVMNAARPVGASGGTVFHSRRIGSGEATKFWGISIQEERETVLILAEKEKKKEIMKAVNEACGMQSQAQGIVLSFPVEELMGF